MTEQTAPKISVIMPVYKVEKYVGKAIECMQKQTLQDFEFLIVDDGSPDNSGKICDDYAAKDARLKVIHKSNGGAPSARNCAMDIAAGKYLYFMDSDDWAEPTMLQDMYELAETNSAQLVIAGFYIDTYYDAEHFVTAEISNPDAVMDQHNFRRQAYGLFDNNLLYTPWNKLFLHAYLSDNNIYYEQTFWDDFPFNLNVIRNVSQVVVTSKMYYHFIRARAESETAMYRPNMYDKREEEHQWMLDLYDTWQIHDQASAEMVARRHVERVIGCVENLFNRNCDLRWPEKKTMLRRMFADSKLRASLEKAVPRSTMMKVMVLPVKLQMIRTAALMGKSIAYVKRRNTRLFAQLKQSR